jgi:MFS family permease
VKVDVAREVQAGRARGLRERALVPTLLIIVAVITIISALGAPLVPLIAERLHTSLGSAQWSLTATLVAGAVASPIMGRLGDGPHRRQVVIGCLSGVVVGGVLAALAQSLIVLILGRVLQGLGLALMPLCVAAARDHLDPEVSPPVIALLSIITAIGVGVGYTLTGLAAKVGGVPGAFWLGAGLTMVALVLAVLVLPPAREREGPEDHPRLDAPGAVLLSIGLVGLLLGFEKGPDWGWVDRGTLGLLAVGLIFLAGWVTHELRTSSPLVDLRLMRHRAVLTADLGALALGMAMYLWISLTTLYVQEEEYGLGVSVFTAGLTLLGLSVGSFVSSRLLIAVGRAVGLRLVIPIGMLCVGTGQLFFGLTADALWQAFVAMTIVGVGVGLTFGAMPGLIVQAVPPSETGSATGFFQVARYAGFAIGSGLAVTLLRALGDDGVPTLSAFRWTYVVGAALCAFTALLTWVTAGNLVTPSEPELERVTLDNAV